MIFIFTCCFVRLPNKLVLLKYTSGFCHSWRVIFWYLLIYLLAISVILNLAKTFSFVTLYFPSSQVQKQGVILPTSHSFISNRLSSLSYSCSIPLISIHCFSMFILSDLEVLHPLAASFLLPMTGHSLSRCDAYFYSSVFTVFTASSLIFLSCLMHWPFVCILLVSISWISCRFLFPFLSVQACCESTFCLRQITRSFFLLIIAVSCNSFCEYSLFLVLYWFLHCLLRVL